MHDASRATRSAWIRWLLLLVTPVLFAGCGTKGVRFVQAPVPPLPSVLAFSGGKFLLNAEVMNKTDAPVQAGALRVDINSRYQTRFAPQCVKSAVQDNVYMAPDGKWQIKEFEFGAGRFAGDPCACTTGFDCTGFVKLTLSNAHTGTMLEGPRTDMSIRFRPPGTLNEMEVEDYSD